MTPPARSPQSSSAPVIAITMGDPQGIGPEILLTALALPSVRRLAAWLIIGDAGVLQRTAGRLRLQAVLRERAVHVLNVPNVPVGRWRPGSLSAAAGRASYEYLQAAVTHQRRGLIDALVTAPVAKAAIQRAGIDFIGHTEFLAEATGSTRIAMMFVGGPLRVALVTRHLALREVPRHITPQAVRQTIELVDVALRGWFGLRRPRIAVASLNPHAGEAGSMGREEITVLRPVIAALRRRIPGLSGPLPPDGAFHAAYRGGHDAVVCMYHDQALIPLKMVARDAGVNLTLGLPFVRTSPDHGTALDIAGRGTADPGAMIAAMRLAARLVGRS